MKKFLTLISAVFIATTFTACFGGDDVSSTPTPSPSPSASPNPSPIVSPSPDVSQEPDDVMGLDLYAQTIREVYADDYLPNTIYDEDEIEEKLGLSKDLYDEIIVEGSTMDEFPDIFVAVKTKEDKVEEVETILENYKEELIENTVYAANIDKIKSAEIYSNNEYVFMLLLGANEFPDSDDDMATNFQNETKKGVDSLKNMFTD